MDAARFLLIALVAGLIAATPVSAAPDLIINSLTFSKTNPLVGETVTVTIITKNAGSTTTGIPTTTHLTRPGGSNDYTVPVLIGGATNTAQYSFTCAAATSYSFTARADYYGGVAESNEGNNDKTATLNCLSNKPDLIISAFSSSLSTPTVGQTTTLTVITKNVGAIASSASTTRVDKPGTSPTTFAITALNPGTTSTKTTTFTCNSAGTKYLGAVADALNTNNEISETNNTMNLTITCGSGPDYVIQELGFSKTNPVVGETVTVTVITKNAGSGNSPSSSTTRLNKPAGQYNNFAVPALSAGSTDTDTTTFTCPSTGSFSFTAITDNTGAVTESDESNNQLSNSINCGTNQPDLIIEAINFSNPTPGLNDTITVYIYTRNIGAGSSGVSTVTRLTAPETRDFTVPVLGVGAASIATYTYTCSSSGIKTFSASADIYSQLNELNEANNAKTVTVNCANPVNLLIWDIDLSGSMIVGQPVTATIITKNIGGAPSKPNTVTHVTKPVGSSDFYIPILAPGAQSSNSLAFNCPSAGTYYL
ncbi:MAG: CARDB domain-containing protein, partial [Candidatus Micrarchaeota archaeon]